MTSPPPISVIMTCYNAERFVDQAVQSVLDQTVADWELIAVDDGSADASCDKLLHWAETDPRIKVHRLPGNRGAGAARDFAITQAAGRFIAIHDADDIASPKRLEHQTDFLEAHLDVVGVGSQATLINENGQVTGMKTFPTAPSVLYRMMYCAIPIQLPSLMVDRSRLPRDFDWFEGWRYSEDTLLFFKLVQHGKLANLREPLVLYRHHAANTSHQFARSFYNETRKARGIARRRLGYKPALSARLISFLQFLAVGCIPERFLAPIYYRMRNRILTSYHVDET